MTSALLRYVGSLGGTQLDTKQVGKCDYYDCSTGGGTMASPIPKQVLDNNALPPQPAGTTRFVVVSDTHEYHHRFVLPKGDVLVHCGDILLSDVFCPRWVSWLRAKAFFKWVESQKHIPHKIVIGGNHDGVLERYGAAEVRKIAGPTTHYLEDETVNILGYTIYGTPRSVGKSINSAFQGPKTWNKAPTDGVGSLANPIDILVPHQPSHLKRLREWAAPLTVTTMHFCGHDHPGHGLKYYLPDDVPTVNAAALRGKFCRERLQPVTVVDLPQPPARRSNL